MRATLIVVLAAACTGEDTLSVNNDPPGLTITYPTSEVRLVEGVPATLVAAITDDLTAPESMTPVWTLDGVELGISAVDVEGTTRFALDPAVLRGLSHHRSVR